MQNKDATRNLDIPPKNGSFIYWSLRELVNRLFDWADNSNVAFVCQDKSPIRIRLRKQNKPNGSTNKCVWTHLMSPSTIARPSRCWTWFVSGLGCKWWFLCGKGLKRRGSYRISEILDSVGGCAGQSVDWWSSRIKGDMQEGLDRDGSSVTKIVSKSR